MISTLLKPKARPAEVERAIAEADEAIRCLKCVNEHLDRAEREGPMTRRRIVDAIREGHAAQVLGCDQCEFAKSYDFTKGVDEKGN